MKWKLLETLEGARDDSRKFSLILRLWKFFVPVVSIVSRKRETREFWKDRSVMVVGYPLWENFRRIIIR